MTSTLQKTVTNSSDFFYFATPKYAVDILIPFLKIKNIGCVWECACGLGHITDVLEDNNIKVYQSDILQFDNNKGEIHKIDFTKQNILPDKNIDAIITNPPYEIKDRFLEKCYELGKPFALLMPLRALGARSRVNMYLEHGIELLVPDSRINYIYHKQSKNNWFHTAWFCHNILPEKLMFTRMNKDDNNNDQIRFC